MPELISPALILVVAALAIGPARGHLRTAVVLLAPLLTLWAVWQVPDGVQDTVRFLSYQIEPVEGSPLRRLFATVFALLAFVGGISVHFPRRVTVDMAAVASLPKPTATTSQRTASGAGLSDESTACGRGDEANF